MKVRLSDFHYLLEQLAEPFTELSISSIEGKCLNVKTTTVQNSVGLIQSPSLIKKFFPLSDDSIFFHNEPTLGCTQFGTIQFIFSESGLLFSCIEDFQIPWNGNSNCLQDFIKIPPFPLVEKGVLNEFIFESFKGNPKLPLNFNDRLKNIVKKIQLYKDQVKQTVKVHPQLFSKEVFQKYLDECRQEADAKIKQKVMSQTQVEFPFMNNALLRLKLTSEESGLKIDFQGTNSSAELCLPEILTDSVCFHLLSQYFQFSHKMNSAIFSLFQIVKPLNSFVGSKNTNQLIHAEQWGIPLLQTALHHALWKMYGKNQTPPHNYFNLNVQFKNDSKVLHFTLPNGRSFYHINNYNNDKGYFTKNNSDGSKTPSMQEFNEIGLEIISLIERPLKSTKCSHSASPGWVLKVKATRHLQLQYYPDIIFDFMKKDKALSDYEPSQIELNGLLLPRNQTVFEIPEGSELLLFSGTSPSCLI